MSVSLCWKSRTMCFTLRTFIFWLALSANTSWVFAKKDGAATAPKTDSTPKSNPSNKHSEPIIEDVTAKQLEKVLNEKDYVAVFWCKLSFSYRYSIF